MGCHLSREIQIIEDKQVEAEEVIDDLVLDGCLAAPLNRQNTPSLHPPSSMREMDHTEKSTRSLPAKEPVLSPEVQPQAEQVEAQPEERPEIIIVLPKEDKRVQHQEVRQYRCYTKTACCGKRCHVANSRLCCEHDFTLPVNLYCSLCRERYQEWKEANEAFEAMAFEMEQQQAAIGSYLRNSQSLGGDYPKDELENSGSFVTYPSWNRFSSFLVAPRTLPCGHTVRRSPADMLEPCPFCKQHPGEGQYYRAVDAAAASASEPPQDEAFEIVYSPPNEIHAASSHEWSSEQRRYMYLTKSPMVSSLGESSTGSMRSF